MGGVFEGDLMTVSGCVVEISIVELLDRCAAMSSRPLCASRNCAAGDGSEFDLTQVNRFSFDLI